MKKIISILFTLCTLLYSCDTDLIHVAKPSIVVEGWIDDGGFPIVIVTETLPISEDYISYDEISNKIIRWATVSISDGEETVILTGKYDSKYMPQYIYTTGHMRGKAGKAYTLTVDYKDYHATATTIIPNSTPLQDIICERIEGQDSLYQLKVIFNDNKNTKDYYQLFCRVEQKSKQFLASYLGSIDDALLKDNEPIPVYQGHTMNMNKEYTPFFHTGDTVAVKLASISKESFDYWDTYIKSISLSPNIFFSFSSNLPTNIIGGNGYWQGMGCSVKHVIVGKPDKYSEKFETI